MDNRPIAKIAFSDNFNDYAPFFDHEWAAEFADRADRARISDVGARLVMQWKAASAARSMTWHLSNSVADLITHQIHAEEPLSLKTIGMMALKIEQQSHIGGIFIDPQLRAGLVREIRLAEADVRQRYMENKLRIAPADLWKSYIEIPDVRLLVWHAEMHAFCQIYFAYETFLKDAVQYKRTKEGGRKSRFVEFLNEQLGADAVAGIWSDRRISFARLVRHAVVHNAAKTTPELSGFRNMLIVSPEGDISVAPNQTRELYSLLQDRANQVCTILSAKSVKDAS